MDKRLVVDCKSIANNVEILKEKTNNAIIYAVLKGNGYGMSISPFCDILYENGIRHFAVTDLSDACLIKDMHNDCGVLLLTPCNNGDDMRRAVNMDITLSVDSLELAKNISDYAVSTNKTAVIHVKIDTGMGRFGFLPEQIDEIKELSSLKNLNVEGIFSHLHSAFNKKTEPSLKQFEIFTDLIDNLKNDGINIPIQHICNSTAIFRFPKMHLTAVRAGSALIGRVPEVCGNTGLTKVGTLVAEICDIRSLPAGHNIGYAALFKTKREQKIACVNVGYADGVAVCKANDTFRPIDILRYIYNDLKLLIKPTPLICKINGKKVKSLGRIGMTSIVLDADEVDANIGDLVEISVNPIYVSPRVEREYI